MFFTRIVPLLWAAIPLLQEAEVPSAESLYRQACMAFSSASPDPAVIYLHWLVHLHPETDYSATAVLSLVEFDLIHERNFAAIERIIDWSVQNLDSTGKQSWVTDDQESRCRQLLATAIDRLDQRQLDQLGSKLSGSKSLASATHLAVIRALARRELKDQRLEQAMEYFSWLGETVDTQEQMLRDFAIPIFLLQNQPSQKSIQLAKQTLDSNARLDISQRFQLHWSIAEVLSRQNDLQAAIAELTEISAWLKDLSDSHGIKDSAAAPSILQEQLHQWQAAADLRLGELLAISGQMDKAESLALLALQSYPHFPGRAGFRFLLTRRYIADIEFDKATGQLQAVLAEVDSSAESQAKAHWMLGEIRLMQKRFDQAIEHYSAVLSVDGQTDWHSRALFQIAKCHEAQSRLMLAVAVYQDLIDQYPESDFYNAAEERLSYLSTFFR